MRIVGGSLASDRVSPLKQHGGRSVRFDSIRSEVELLSRRDLREGAEKTRLRRQLALYGWVPGLTRVLERRRRLGGLLGWSGLALRGARQSSELGEVDWTWTGAAGEPNR